MFLSLDTRALSANKVGQPPMTAHSSSCYCGSSYLYPFHSPRKHAPRKHRHSTHFSTMGRASQAMSGVRAPRPTRSLKPAMTALKGGVGIKPVTGSTGKVSLSSVYPYDRDSPPRQHRLLDNITSGPSSLQELGNERTTTAVR